MQVADRETDEDAGEAQPHPSLGVEGVSPALLGGQLSLATSSLSSDSEGSPGMAEIVEANPLGPRPRLVAR